MLSHEKLGFGLGLRPSHYPYIFENRPQVDWFEIISENFMDTGGKPRRHLQQIRENYPVVMHGVSLSIGSIDPLCMDYLRQLKTLMDEIEPAWVSDHLCWSGVAHQNLHDLLPLPYTEESLSHLVSRIDQVQNYLGRSIALENPSTYLQFAGSTMSESQFINRMVEQSGCHLLLDVNNVYVSCYNHGSDPKEYLDSLPLDRVIQVHLSGHSNHGTHIIDTHDDFVVDEVWALYQYLLARAGRTPNTMIEWDDKIPEFPVLLNELNKARSFAEGDQPKLKLPQTRQQKSAVIQSVLNLPLAQSQHRLKQAMQNALVTDTSVDWVQQHPKLSAEQQLQIYTDAYRCRLIGVAAPDYPLLKATLGAQSFDDLMEAFVVGIPSTHFNIARHIEQLPKFVAAFMPDNRFAHELCQLETLLSRLADAEETGFMEATELRQYGSECLMQARLVFRAAFALLETEYPVSQCMDEFYAAKEQPPLQYADSADTSITVAIDKLTVPNMGSYLLPCFLAVYRHNDKMWRLELEPAEHSLIGLLRKGCSLESALTHLLDSGQIVSEKLEQNLTRWLCRWTKNHLICAVDTSSYDSTSAESSENTHAQNSPSDYSIEKALLEKSLLKNSHTSHDLPSMAALSSWSGADKPLQPKSPELTTKLN